MRCLSCHEPVLSRNAQLWSGKILVCPRCYDLAERARAALKVASERAMAQAMADLEQKLLGGVLVAPGSGMELPGMGGR